MQKTNRNKGISANKIPGIMLSLKNCSDDTDLLIDVWGSIFIELSIYLLLKMSAMYTWQFIFRY